MDYFDHTLTTSGKDSQQGQAAAPPAGGAGGQANPQQGDVMNVTTASNHLSPQATQSMVNLHMNESQQNPPPPQQQQQQQQQQPVMPSPQPQSMIHLNSQQQMPAIPQQQTDINLAQPITQETVVPNGLTNGDSTTTYSHMNHYNDGHANHIETPATYTSTTTNLVNSTDVYAPTNNPIPNNPNKNLSTNNPQHVYQQQQQQYYPPPSSVISGKITQLQICFCKNCK